MFGTKTPSCLELLLFTLSGALPGASVENTGRFEAVLVAEGTLEKLKPLSVVTKETPETVFTSRGYTVISRTDQLLVLAPSDLGQFDSRKKEAELLLELVLAKFPGGLGSSQSLNASARRLLDEVLVDIGKRPFPAEGNFALFRTATYTLDVDGKTFELPPLNLTDNAQAVADHLIASPVLEPGQRWMQPPREGAVLADRIAREAREYEIAKWLTPGLTFKILSEPMPAQVRRFELFEKALHELGNWVRAKQQEIDALVSQADQLFIGATPVAPDITTMSPEFRSHVRETFKSSAARLGVTSEVDLARLWDRAQVTSVTVNYSFATCQDRSGPIPVVGSFRLGTLRVK